MKARNLFASVFIWLIPAVGFPDDEARTNASLALLKSKTVVPSQEVIVRDKDGSTNHIRCVLVEELRSVQRPRNQQTPGGSTRTRVALISDDPAKQVIWSYWPPNFPLSYDFKVATSPEASIVVFAKNYSIGVIERIDRNNLPTPDPEAEQPSPHFIDLKEMVGEDAFAPDAGVVMNALTRNLRIERVYYDKTWHITIRGKGGKLYEVVRQGPNWELAPER